MSPRVRAWLAWFIGAAPAYAVGFACSVKGVSLWMVVPAAACVWIVAERAALRLLGASGASR
jgi:hypothetical protein